MSLFVVPEVDEIGGMSPADLEACIRGFEGERRRVDAQLAMLVNRVEVSGAFLSDHHRSVRAWSKAACNWSGPEAFQFAQVGRMLARFPTAAAAAAAGRLGVAQMRVLAAVVANPRLKGVLGAGEDHLVGRAGDCDFDDFLHKVAEWVALADEDGAHGGHERADRDRRAHASIVGDRFYLDAAGGVVHGKLLKEILDAFSQAEWFADWEAGVLEHGEEMYPGLMGRTDPQRRFDALIAVFVTAATAMQPGPVPEPEPEPDTDTEPETDTDTDTDTDTEPELDTKSGPAPAAGSAPSSGRSSGAGCGVVVNLMVGYEYFMYHLRKALGDNPSPLDLSNPLNRCTTADGVPIDPADMLVGAALGHVRRVVLDSKGVVLDMGRRQRLFTGPLRDAVMMTNRWCIWPGCARRAAHCEADHLLPWGHEGPTKSGNGGPACGYHNRWKSTGYRTWHDPDGHWHHYRPDGTEIGWRADLNTTHPVAPDHPITATHPDTTHNPAA